MVHSFTSSNQVPHNQPLLFSTNSKNLSSRILLCFSTLQFQCKLMNSSQTSPLFPHQFPPSFSFKKTSRTIFKCSVHNNKGFYHQPFSVFLPIIRKIKSLTALRGPDSGSCVQTIGGSDILHKNGTFFAIAVTAKVKISPIVATLAANPTFVSGLFAWFIAQSMKVFLNFWLEKRWDFRVMCASGGMPSSHTALCTALTTSVAICHGVADSLFPVCLGFSLIVMYDAIGVRRHAGMQAEVLNMIIADLFQGHPISQRKLKELLGHTPSQVLAGALLGIMVSWFCCQGHLITPRV